MRFTDQTTLGGVTEQLFTLDDLPGVLWQPENPVGTRPLILMGHGGGQHKKAPGMVARARRYAAEGGFAVAVVDAPSHGDRPKDTELTRLAGENRVRMEAGEPVAAILSEFHALVAEQSVPEWQRVLDALLGTVCDGPVGYFGVSMGCGLGVPFVAAEPRVRAAVLGLGPVHAGGGAAAAVTVPVEFLVQWDDERIPREESLALFDALGSTEKSLHANVGGHGDVPMFEIDSSLRFFLRHLR